MCVCVCAFFFRFFSIIGYYKTLNIVSWLSSKESACQTGDVGLIPGSERSPGEGTGNPLQYSCLLNPMMEEFGGLQSMGLKESDTTE